MPKILQISNPSRYWESVCDFAQLGTFLSPSSKIEAAQYKCESFNGLKHVSAYVLYNKHGYVVGFNIKSVCNDDTKIEHSIKNKK